MNTTNTERTLYTETLGPATVTIYSNGIAWGVKLIDTAKNAERLRFPQTYEDAIVSYNNTCEFAAKLYNVERPLPDAPDFTKTITR